jgi:hypothetical protein
MGYHDSNGFYVEDTLSPQLPSVMYARGAVFANISDLGAFTVASNDGLTYAKGQRVLLTLQTTASQCGLYVVGEVNNGVAKLTRAPEWSHGQAVRNGAVVHVSEGTLWAGSEWKAMVTGAKVIGTDDPLFYPKHVKGILTLAAGTKTLGATEGLFLFSVTRSVFHLTQNTPGTTTSTTEYCAVSASRVAGKSGTAAIVVRANVAAGTINTADVSTLDWLLTNY